MQITQDKFDRTVGIGCSEIAALFDKSPYTNQYDLWLVKTKQKVEEEIKVSVAMRHGLAVESFIATLYQERTGAEVFDLSKTLKHVDVPLFGSLDRAIIEAGDQTKKMNVLELKTVNFWGFTPSNGWGQEGTDQIPMHYKMQVYGYIALLNADYADIAVLVGGSDLKIYRVVKEEYAINTILEKIKLWWKKHIIEGIAPENDKDKLKNLLIAKNEINFECTSEVANILHDMQMQKDNEAKATAEIERLTDSLLKLVGNKVVITSEDKPIAEIRRLKTKTTVRLL
jgi:putative phage-type endonuclease